ncbi:hypothetical protein [Streptomyces scabiei]|uniref:hypothetical protein n=1 Tax=Streptomyces scabiei TaxID=1930 RepID=UPI00131C72B4|nr:hypothetical protein [Streptomyces scabiei]
MDDLERSDNPRLAALATVFPGLHSGNKDVAQDCWIQWVKGLLDKRAFEGHPRSEIMDRAEDFAGSCFTAMLVLTGQCFLCAGAPDWIIDMLLGWADGD